MALLHTFRTVLLLALATALTLTFALAGAASAQLEELQEQCPPEFPLCPEGEDAPEEDDDALGDDDFGDDGVESDPQVQETPEGAVAAGTGAPTGGSTLPLLVLASTLGLATVAGLAARRRFAPGA